MNFIKKLIKKILRSVNWKLVKIRRKKPSNYVYSSPKKEWVESILKSDGINHIGAHRGSEAPIYNWFNKKVIWLEANPELFDDLEDNINDYYNQKAYLSLLGDETINNKKFYVSNKDASCSSIFNFSENVRNKKLWAEHGVKMNKTISLNMITMDNFAQKNNLNISDYNLWIIDVQGSELQVLRGAINSLKKCNNIIVEISKKQFYENGSTNWVDLKKFLNENGFKNFEEPTEDHCDVLFSKNN